jgi:hypothetical protein
MKQIILLLTLVLCLTSGLLAQGTYIDFWPDMSLFKNKETDLSNNRFGISGKAGIPIQSEPLMILAVEYDCIWQSREHRTGGGIEYKVRHNSYFLAPSLVLYPIPDFQVSLSPGVCFRTTSHDHPTWEAQDNPKTRFQYAASIAYDVGDIHGLLLGLRFVGYTDDDFTQLTSSFFIRYRFKWL